MRIPKMIALVLAVVAWQPSDQAGAQTDWLPEDVTVLPPTFELGPLKLVPVKVGQPPANTLIEPPSIGIEPGDPTGETVEPHERAALSADALSVAAGNNQFALDIYRQITASTDQKNVLVSPFSISTALAMTYAGARGETARQMADVLRFQLPDERLHPAYGELIADLDADREGYRLSVANRLFGQEGYSFKHPFLDITSGDYGAPLEELDFYSDPEGSRTRINRWVEDKTNDKIRNLLPGGSVTRYTRLVLTNAIHFDGSWKYKFDERLTQEEPFYLADGSESTVSLMFQQGSFKYGDFDGFQMLEMPYAGDDLSMVVMLPDAVDGLDELEASVSTELLETSLNAMHQREVLVHLPKFTFDGSFQLGGTLYDMGMTDAFGGGDFTGIADDGLMISDVIHKTFIDVNEEGTEAAAATAVIVGTTCLCGPPPPPPVFRADHPFLFALRDTHSDSLLFLGRVMELDASGVATSDTAVPEPTSAALLVIGALMFVARRRACS